jgi:hypothetical protein
MGSGWRYLVKLAVDYPLGGLGIGRQTEGTLRQVDAYGGKAGILGPTALYCAHLRGEESGQLRLALLTGERVIDLAGKRRKPLVQMAGAGLVPGKLPGRGGRPHQVRPRRLDLLKPDSPPVRCLSPISLIHHGHSLAECCF